MTAPGRLCPACGTDLPAGDRFCAACGAPASDLPAGPGWGQRLLLLTLILATAVFVTSRFAGEASPPVLAAAFGGVLLLGMVKFGGDLGVPLIERAARLIGLLIVLSSGLLVLWLYCLIQSGRLAP